MKQNHDYLANLMEMGEVKSPASFEHATKTQLIKHINRISEYWVTVTDLLKTKLADKDKAISAYKYQIEHLEKTQVIKPESEYIAELEEDNMNLRDRIAYYKQAVREFANDYCEMLEKDLK